MRATCATSGAGTTRSSGGATSANRASGICGIGASAPQSPMHSHSGAGPSVGAGVCPASPACSSWCDEGEA